jgi:3-methyl-2-oxobutanoate hydroxymethyltransferase
LALENAQRFISHGADGVKLEGFKPEVIQHLTEQGIEVCAHLGLNPQIHDKKGLHGKTVASAIELVSDALSVETAGARLIVFEMIPEEVGRIVTQKLTIPTIGIGAGRYTDGQVLIVSDLLGINSFDFRHVTKYEDFSRRAKTALGRYAEDVLGGHFPKESNVRHLSDSDAKELDDWARNEGGSS